MFITQEQPTEAEKEVARSDSQEYLYLHQERRRLFPLAAPVGLCSRLVAVLFRGALALADTVRPKIMF